VSKYLRNSAPCEYSGVPRVVLLEQLAGALTVIEPSNMEISGDARILTLYGIRYAIELFEHIGVGPVGSCIEIVSRDDGVVTLKRLPNETSRDVSDAPCLMCGQPRLAHRLSKVHQGMFDPRMPAVCPEQVKTAADVLHEGDERGLPTPTQYPSMPPVEPPRDDLVTALRVPGETP
jgi:hypothetical protein